MNGTNWDDVAVAFDAAVAALDPPATWVELARMGRRGQWPTPEHEAVWVVWRERRSRHLTESAGGSRVRSGQVAPNFKSKKAS